MDVFTVRVWPCDDEHVHDFPAVEFEGKIWTVLAWRAASDGKSKSIGLAIPQEKLRLFPYTRPEFPSLRFAASERPPRDALYPPVAQELLDQYGIVELPDIRLPLP